jgi:hypothetical protein
LPRSLKIHGLVLTLVSQEFYAMIGTRILYHHTNALGEKAQGFQKQAEETFLQRL